MIITASFFSKENEKLLKVYVVVFLKLDYSLIYNDKIFNKFTASNLSTMTNLG